MKKRFTVYDSKAEAFLEPLFYGATGEAIRAFEGAANKEGHDFKLHAGDYTLFETGTWDEQTDTHTTIEAKINLGTALQFIKQVKRREPALNFEEYHSSEQPKAPPTNNGANPNHGFPYSENK